MTCRLETKRALPPPRVRLREPAARRTTRAAAARRRAAPTSARSLKNELKRRGIKDVRANSAGCLDACADGPTVVVYPEGVWYGRVRLEDVAEIIDEHLVGGRPVERLLIPRFARDRER